MNTLHDVDREIEARVATELADEFSGTFAPETAEPLKDPSCPTSPRSSSSASTTPGAARELRGEAVPPGLANAV
jgi:hypothetical protein